MKYFIIAGEASGDLHASTLMQGIKELDSNAEFRFLGGNMMASVAGHAPVIHYKQMAFMGFTEVLRHLPDVLGNFKAARRAIDEFVPDRLVLVDYPSFNLKMAKYAHKRGIRVSYYISPKIWAWKEWRIKAIKKYVDQMLCIFPFERDFYRRHGMEVEYVGNPSVGEIDARLAAFGGREQFIAANRLPDKPLVALLPGSRMAELRTNLPIMTAAMRRFPQYRGVVAAAPGIDPQVYASLTNLPVVTGQTTELVASSRLAVVTSGTATLETALIGTPQVAMFRHNGSKLMRKLKDKVLNVKYVTLPNLVCNEEIIPELLLDLCTVESVYGQMAELLPDRSPRQAQIDNYKRMRQLLSAPSTAAAALVGEISRKAQNQKINSKKLN